MNKLKLDRDCNFKRLDSYMLRRDGNISRCGSRSSRRDTADNSANDSSRNASNSSSTHNSNSSSNCCTGCSGNHDFYEFLESFSDTARRISVIAKLIQCRFCDFGITQNRFQIIIRKIFDCLRLDNRHKRNKVGNVGIFTKPILNAADIFCGLFTDDIVFQKIVRCRLSV